MIIFVRPDTEKTATEDSKPQAITTQDIDLARAYIGISKGNLLMGSYVVSIESNLTALLDWKLARVDISPNSDAELLNDTHSTAEASQTETLN